MNNDLDYPTESLLYWWIRHIEKENNHYLKPFLPKADKDWGNRIVDKINLLRTSYYPQDLHSQGALIFYKINKAHSEIDSNKRTSIIVVFLFYLINNHSFYNPQNLRIMAKKIAKSHGRVNQEKWLEKIKNMFIKESFNFETN